MIKNMKGNRLFDLFISFASSVDDSEHSGWNLMLLEIFFLIFSPYNPLDILKAPSTTEVLVCFVWIELWEKV